MSSEKEGDANLEKEIQELIEGMLNEVEEALGWRMHPKGSAIIASTTSEDALRGLYDSLDMVKGKKNGESGYERWKRREPEIIKHMEEHHRASLQLKAQRLAQLPADISKTAPVLSQQLGEMKIEKGESPEEQNDQQQKKQK